MSLNRLLTIDQLSELLQIKKSTIYQWTHEGYIPHKKIGKLVRFNEVEVTNWLDGLTKKGRKRRIPEFS